MKVGDLVVHKGFSENKALHYGAWGIVLELKNDFATVGFTRLHSPRPDRSGAEILSAARFMCGVEMNVPVARSRDVATVPSDVGTATVWEWYGEYVSYTQIEAVRALWISALRSGEYRQTIDCLRNNKGFSAMGVACDVIGKRYGITWRRMDRVTGILGKFTTMPKAFLQLLGISADEAEFIEKMSDSGTGFREIASIISDRHDPRMKLAS